MVDTSALFTPFKIRDVTLRNRFVVPGMQRWKCVEGAPTTELAEYYRQRALGGFSLIFGESCAIDHPSASQQVGCARINRSTQAAWRHCVERVSDAGGHLLLQLWHEGATRTEGGTGPHSSAPTVSPSGLVSRTKRNGRPLRLDELPELRHSYVRSALMAQEVGAAGVEVHAAHGYLLDQFLWGETNRRDDGYGGDAIADRVRFPAEVVRAIRDAVGGDFIISFRMSQWKEVDYRSARIVHSPDELQQMLSTLQGAGVDVIHASMRRFYEPEWPQIDAARSFAGWCKALSGVPVIAVGSVGVSNDMVENIFLGSEAQNIVEGSLVELTHRFEVGEFDLVAVGRASIGDPRWVNKVRAGRYDEVRPFLRADLMRGLVWDAGVIEASWEQDGLPEWSKDDAT